MISPDSSALWVDPSPCKAGMARGDVGVSTAGHGLSPSSAVPSSRRGDGLPENLPGSRLSPGLRDPLVSGYEPVLNGLG